MKALQILATLLFGALLIHVEAARSQYVFTEDCFSASGQFVGVLTVEPGSAYFNLEHSQKTLICERRKSGYRCDPEDGGEFGDGYPSAVFQDDHNPRTGQIFYWGTAGEEPSYDDLTCQ